MYHVVIVDHNGMVVLLTRNECEGSKGVDGADDDDDTLWNDLKKMGLSALSLRKIKALIV